MISIKDYAKKWSVSYEAVRKQVDMYANELCNHITTQGRTRYLDDFAVDFLDSKRRKSVVFVEESLQTEKETEYQKQITELQERLIEAQDIIIKLQQERQTEQAALTDFRLKYENTLLACERAEEKEAELTKKLTAAEADLNSYHKTIFGLYRKK